MLLDEIDITLFFTITGTLAAIFLPIVGWLLRRKDSRQLDVVLENEVFLVNQLAKDIDNFSIIIDGEPRVGSNRVDHGMDHKFGKL